LKQKLNKRETLIFLGTILVALSGFYKSCVVTGIKEISDSKQQIESLREERAQLTTQIKAEKEKKNDYPYSKTVGWKH
jgi:hypothetical protein